MAVDPNGRDEAWLAALSGRLPAPPLPPAYFLGLVLVSTAMVVLPLLYLALVAASAWLAVWWASNGFDLLMRGPLASAHLRFGLFVVPLVAAGAVPAFLVKPLFAPRITPPSDLQLTRGDQPGLFAFVERLAGLVGAPVPDRIVVDCQVNAGAGLELGLLRRDGPALTLRIGLPLVAGLTLPQLAGILAHEFGHFGQGAGMRLARVIRRVNAWFQRVAAERDSWDQALADGRREGGWWGLACLGAELLVALGRQALYGLMVAGHAISCFLSRQMEFDADQYEGRVAGSSGFADAALRLRVLDASAQFVLGSVLREGRFVDDVPALIARVADQAPPRLTADIKRAVQLSGTGLFDSHPSDMERIRRVRLGRFPGLLAGVDPASQLFRDFPGLCRRATAAFYEDALGPHAPPLDALVPVDALAPAAPAQVPAVDARSKPARLEFPPERPPRLAAHAAAARGSSGTLAAARQRWREAAPAAAAAAEKHRRSHAQWVDAAIADAVLAMGLGLQAREFSLPTATPEGVARTRSRALAMQAEAAPALEAAERALGERVGLAFEALERGSAALPEGSRLHQEARRLLAALPGLERLQAEALGLRRDAAVLDCLLANQRRMVGHEGLDRAVAQLLPTVRDAINAVRSGLEQVALPGASWDIPPPWREDAAGHVRSARRALEVLEAQHARAVARLVQIADQVEAAQGPGGG